MDSELDKIDVIRSRFKVSYEEARDVLTRANGDVIDALIALENNPPESCRPDLLALGAEVVEEVQKLVVGGPIKKLKFRYGSKLVAETPVALTAAAALAVGVFAILVSKLIIEVERSEEEAAS